VWYNPVSPVTTISTASTTGFQEPLKLSALKSDYLVNSTPYRGQLSHLNDPFQEIQGDLLHQTRFQTARLSIRSVYQAQAVNYSV